ncbi:MAG: MFS transporter [Bacillota bacterium]|nr:MFS transporter [Bacillota bacterium]
MGKILNSSYGVIFGAYWIIYAIVSSFSSVFMLAKGYTNSQIGITLAAANVLAVILQPLVADFADRSKKPDILGVTEIITVCMMIFLIGMFAFGGGTAALCIVFVLLIGFHTVLQPLFNSLAFSLERCGVAINYGIARAAGSLAYSVFVVFFGTLVERRGVNIMPAAGELSCLILIASLIFTGHYFKKAMKANEGRKTDAFKADSGDEEDIDLIRFIRRNRMFFVMNLGIVGLYFSNSVLNFYMAQIVDGVEGSTEDMGRILGVMAFLEIPTMVFFRQLKNRFSCRFLLKVAGIGFTVKIALCRLAGSVIMLYVAHLFQPVSFALFLPGMVYFTDEVMSRGEAVKGQALYTTMITVSTVIASLLGGIILDAAGSKMLTLIATLITAAGAATVICVIDKVKGGKKNV